jgi:hypothetical protein
MPNFTQGGFGTGIQRQITIIDNNTSLPVDLGGDLISFESSPKVTKIEVKPIDNGGYNKFKRAYDGWTGKLVVDHVTGSLDAFQAAQEANYHAGGAQNYYTIDEVTRNDDGSIDTYQYQFCCIDLSTAGDWKKDSATELTLEFDAQSRS